jgi:hypothetical protein
MVVLPAEEQLHAGGFHPLPGLDQDLRSGAVDLVHAGHIQDHVARFLLHRGVDAVVQLLGGGEEGRAEFPKHDEPTDQKKPAQ